MAIVQVYDVLKDALPSKKSEKNILAIVVFRKIHQLKLVLLGHFHYFCYVADNWINFFVY